MKQRSHRAAAAVTLSFVAVAYLWPLGAIVERAFVGGPGLSRLSWSIVGSTLGDARIGRLARFTLIETTLSVLVTLIVGLPLAWVLGRLEFRGRRTLMTMCIVPFVLPTVVVAAAFASLVPSAAVFGGGGGGAATLALIVAAHVFFNVGIVIRTVAAFIGSIDPGLEAAARSLGRSRVGAIRSVVAPLAGPAVAAAALIVALFTLTSFGIIVALGGGSQGTIEVEIWYDTTQLLHLPAATVLSLAQLVVVGALVVLYQRLVRRRARGTGVSLVARRPAHTSGERWAVRATAALLLVVVGTPLAALAIRSVRWGDSWTFDHYRHLGSTLAATSLAVSPWSALANSLRIAAVAAAMAVAIAIPAAVASSSGGRWGRLIDRAVMLPLGTSAATIGFGFIAAFSGPLLDLRGTWIVVPLIQATVAVPIVVRTVVPALRAIPASMSEAAATCGAGRLRRAVEVSMPLIRRPLVMAIGLALAVSLGEFGATSFVSRSESTTVPIAIERLLLRPGAANLGQAMALSCILAALCAAVFGVVDLVAEGRTGEF